VLSSLAPRDSQPVREDAAEGVDPTPADVLDVVHDLGRSAADEITDSPDAFPVQRFDHGGLKRQVGQRDGGVLAGVRWNPVVRDVPVE
jgi:hypothetical protein